MTTAAGATTVNQLYCAYGRQRTVSGGVSSCPGGNSLPTGHTFTGQKLDGTGLQYYNARYYDPAMGAFISPDTIVPDATNVFDYNRYMMARGNPLKYNDPTGHYSADEIIQHFSCDNWECVTAQFDGGNPDSSYAGNGAWLYVLINAVDGDKITAQNPDSTVTMTGRFARNAETGKIGIQMLLADGTLTGAIPEQSFANYGAINQYAGGTRYALETSRNNPVVSGPAYYLPGMCGGVWDCTALSYDAAALSGSVLVNVSLAGELPSGGLTTSGVVVGMIVNQAATAGGLVYTIQGYKTGDSSAADLAVISVTSTLNPFPVIGTFAGIGQLIWDLADPFHPW